MTITPRAAVGGAEVDEDIERLVDEAPPLSPEQRDRLAVLLNPARLASSHCVSDGSP